MESTKKTNVTTHHVSIGPKMSPIKLKGEMETSANHPNIYIRENDKLNYLSALLSRTEFTGDRFDTLRMVIFPKLMYQYKQTILQNDDLVQMDLAKRLLVKITSRDEKPHKTCSCTKSETDSAETTVKTAGATNEMVNITAKFMM